MKLKREMIFAAALLLLIGSFFLPNVAAGITDSRRLDSLVLADSQSVSFESTPELSLLERIALVASSKTEILALKTGQVMDYDEASGRVAQELSRFFREGAFAFNFNRYTVEDGTAEFVIDSGNPAVNMIVWEFNLYDPLENSVTVTIDDETGVILKLIYRWGNRSTGYPGVASANPDQSDEGLNGAAADLTGMMTAYYGLPVALADYQFSGSLAYYRADIASNGVTVPMYGVMRSTSFTMNERLFSFDD